MRRFVPALAAVVAAGCGYMGDPLPPLANIPQPVAGLSVIQRGAHLVASFLLPTLTTEGRMITTPLDLDLRVGVAGTPFAQPVWVSTATRVAAVPAPNGVATYEIPTAPWSGKTVAVAVRVTGVNGKPSEWSNFVILPVVAPPPQPKDVRAIATAQGVVLSWQAEGGDFRVFRRVGDQPFAPIGDAPKSPFTDVSSGFGTTYTYSVQTIVKLPDNREAESDPSIDVLITPADTFPPAVPTGVVATAAGAAVEVTWDGDTDADLAGYRIYRAAAAGPFQKIADTSILPAYSDRTAQSGQTYRYAVSAVDQEGNESALSAAAEALVP